MSDEDRERITAEEAVKRLDALAGTDGEDLHAAADSILESVLPDEVYEAFNRVVDRADGWHYA